jgi:predicted nucleic acid-binding protein
MVQTWILDASPLILLHKIDFLTRMSRMSDRWLIPAGVIREIEKKNSIQDYIKQLGSDSHVEVIDSIQVNPSIGAWDLGQGESEAISFALERGQVGVILDDLQARKCAKVFDIPLKGTLGVVVWAKKEGIIENLKPYFDNLISAGIRISPEVLLDLLTKFGEK